MDSPEYKTLTQCYPRLFSCVQQSPNDIAVQLKPLGVLAPADWTSVSNQQNDKHYKAQVIVDALQNQVKINPQVFFSAVSALKAAGEWTKTIVGELQDTYFSLSAVSHSFRDTTLGADAGSRSPKAAGSSAQAQTSRLSGSDSQMVRHQVEVKSIKPAIGGADTAEQTLDQNMNSMRREFAGLLHEVITSIKESGKTVRDLATYLQQIESVNVTLIETGNSCLLFTTEFILKIETMCGDIDDVFTKLNGHYSWFNLDLIECIIKEFCDENYIVKKKLSGYKARMRQFCESKLCRFPDPCNEFGEYRDDTKSCEFKVDEQWSNMKLGDLEPLKTIFCNVLKLKRLALGLHAVRRCSNGCVKIMHDISEHIANFVFPLSKEQVEKLKKHGIEYCKRSFTLPDDDDEYFSCEEDNPQQTKGVDPASLIPESMAPLQFQSTSNVARAPSQEPSTSDLSDDSDSSQPPSGVGQQSGGNSSSTSLQQVSYLLFECGCGQCSVYNYISGKVCPNPKQLPFPKLKVSAIPPEEIEYIEEDFCRQSISICRRFYGLVCDTFTELQKRVEDSELISYLRLALKPKWYLQASLSSSKDIDKVENVKPCDLPEYLIDRNYCSWFDYDLIEDLRQRYLFSKVTDKDKALSDYKEHLRCYVNQRCFIYLHDTGPWPKTQVEVKVKLDLEFGKLCQQLIKHLKYAFAKTIGAPTYHLAFKTVQEGCTELIFGGPPYFSEIKMLHKYQIRQLRDHGFFQVTIHGQKLLQGAAQEDSLTDSLSSIELGEQTDSDNVQEADSDTAMELTHTETNVEVSYKELLNTVICKRKLKLKEGIPLNVSPCSFWEALHDGYPYMALVYSGKIANKAQFSEFIVSMLTDQRSVLKVCCVHLDNELSDNPILLFKPEQSLKNYCTAYGPLSGIDQLTILRDIAVGTLDFMARTNSKLTVTLESVFVHKEGDTEITTLFLPLYQISYFPEAKPQTDYQWIKEVLLLMNQIDMLSELQESHILYNILKYKWFSHEKSLQPKDLVEVTKEISYILDLENTRAQLIHSLTSSDVLQVSHLHMILIGHNGVGKTSIRKHLQNIRFNEEEKSTIIVEQELLYQVTMEASIDSSSAVFQKCESVYQSETDKVFLTLWDTGGQPMFQDLLPCFAKLRSIYCIVFRICDLLENQKALVRPVCSILECEKESSYTCVDYIHRSIAFLDFFSYVLHSNFSNLPPEVRTRSFESTDLETFPRVALIGTFKDTVREDDLQLQEKYSQLKNDLERLEFDFSVKALLPEPAKSVIFEVDNTRSGQKYEDPGIKDLRKQIVACTNKAKAKVPSAWIAFKVELEHESRIQQPCTGSLTFQKVSEIAKKYEVDPVPILCYFHELGIFLWHYEKESLKDYVVVEPKNFVSILGTVLNPETFIDSPKQWKQLQNKGIIDTQIANQLLDSSKTGLPLKWIFSFFEEHRLSVPTKEGYFIPSMLQMVPVCPNYLHIYDSANHVCTSLTKKPDLEIAPLFLVPKSKCIPPGLFPRLMTVLAGIQEGEIVWKLPFDANHCKNKVSFIVNDQACIEFIEFFHCIRAYLTSLPGYKISKELCRGILSQLRVQVQRVIPQASGSPVNVTFTCVCSSTPHFLPHLPSNTEDIVLCNEQTFELTDAHKKWIMEPRPKTEEDAKKLFEEALRNGSVTLQISTILFIGSIKAKIFSKNKSTEQDSNYYIVDNYVVRRLQPDYLESFFADSAAFPVLSTASSSHEENNSPIEQPAAVSVNEDNSTSLSIPEASSVITAAPETSFSDVSSTTSSPIAKSNMETSNLDENIKKQTVMRSSGKGEITTEFPEQMQNANKTWENVHTGILGRMCAASEEQRSLVLLQTVECSEVTISKLLPLFAHQICVGVVGTDQIGILKKIHHVSNKWMIVEVENDQTRDADITDITDTVKHKLLTESIDTDVLFASCTALKKIVKLSSKALRKVVPYAWYYFCYLIQKQFQETNRKVLSYSEVSALCHDCCVSVDDLKKVLKHLHESGLLVYYGDVLPNQIFEDISVPLSIFRSVLMNLAQANDTYIANKDYFRQVDNVYVDGVFTHLDAVKLFEGLCLFFQMEVNSFCIPYANENFLNRKNLGYYIQTPNLPSLFIQYNETAIEFGFLVCFLISNNSSDLWQWKLLTNKVGKPTCVFKNCVQFMLPGYDCIITLFNSARFVEVHVEYSDSLPPLKAIRRAIFAGLERAHNMFCFAETFDYAFGFLCTCGCVSREHLAILSEEKELLICSENSEASFKLSSINWFDTDTSLEDDSISVNTVFKALLPQSETWYKVGIGLGVDTQTLSRISSNHKDRNDLALMSLVQHWFQNNPNPNWTTINSLLTNKFNEEPVAGCSNHGYTVLLTLCNKLIRGLSRDPRALAYALFEKGFIPQKTIEEIVQIPATDTQNAHKLFNKVLDVVRHSPRRYDDFISVLEESALLYGDLLVALREAHSKADLTDDQLSFSIPHTPLTTPATEPVAGCSNHGYTVLLTLCNKLIRGLSRDPRALAYALFEKGFIPQKTIEEIVQIPATDTQNAHKLFNKVLDVVRHSPRRYDDFISVLEESALLYGDLLVALREAHSKADLTDDQLSFSIPHTPLTTPATEPVAGCSNHGYTVLLTLCNKLIRGLSRDPRALAYALFEKGFIPQKTIEEIVQIPATDTQNAHKLFNKVLDVVRHSPRRYDDFISVLEESALLYGDLLVALREAHSKADLTDDQLSFSIPHTPLTTPATGYTSTEDQSRCDLQSKIDILEILFHSLAKQTFERLQKAGVSVSTFYAKVSCMKPSLKRLAGKYLENVFENCVSSSGLEYVWGKFNYFWDFYNYELLQHVIRVMFTEEGDPLLSQLAEYEDKIGDFLASTKLSNFLKVWPLSTGKPQEKEIAELKRVVVRVDRRWEDCTLHDVKNISNMFTQCFFFPREFGRLAGVGQS